MAASLTQRSLTGIRWSAATQVVAQIAQYGAFVVLARVLTPGEYGTLASAMLVAGVLALVHEAGLGAAIIQRPELTRGHRAACLAANLAIGVILAVGVWVTAPLLAGFFRDPAVADVLRLLALGFPIAAAGVLPRALLERDLQFKSLGLVEAAAAVANGGLTIGLALAGFGVWAMVAGALAGTLLQAVAVWAVARPDPGFTFSRAELRDLMGFGSNVLGSRLLGYAIGNIDYVIVGRLLGPAALGVYSLAYKLVTWPMLKVSHVVLRVAFPAFARLQADDAVFRRHYLKLVGTLALVAFPLLAGLAVVAPELLPLVFGPQWAGAVFATQVLCGVGALKALVCSIGTVFLGKGRPDIELKLNAFGVVKLSILLLIGVRWGVEGVALAYLVSSLTGIPVQQHFANKLIGLTWKDYLAAIAAPTGAAALMLLALGGWRMVGTGLGPIGFVALAVPLGGVAYVVALQAMGVDWRGLVRLVAGRPVQAAPASMPIAS